MHNNTCQLSEMSVRSNKKITFFGTLETLTFFFKAMSHLTKCIASDISESMCVPKINTALSVFR